MLFTVFTISHPTQKNYFIIAILKSCIPLRYNSQTGCICATFDRNQRIYVLSKHCIRQMCGSLNYYKPQGLIKLLHDLQNIPEIVQKNRMRNRKKTGHSTALCPAAFILFPERAVLPSDTSQYSAES